MSLEKIKEENIERVLKQALISFGEYGIEATTLLLLAEKTGISVRSINRYFDGKSNLIEQAAELFLRDFFAYMQKLFNASDVTKETGLEQVSLQMRMQFEWFHENHAKILLLAEMERYLLIYDQTDAHGERLLKKYFIKTKEYQAMLEKTLHKGIDDGSIRSDLDVPEMSKMLCIGFISFFKRLAMYIDGGEMQNFEEVEKQFNLFSKMVYDCIKNK